MKRKTIKLLICDYHSTFSTLLAEKVSEFKFVRSAAVINSYNDAFAQLYNNDIDLLLIDINKILRNRLQLVSQLKKINPSLRVLALSLFTSDGIENVLEQYGFDGIISRVNDIGTIEDQITSVCKRQFNVGINPSNDASASFRKLTA